VEEEEEAEDEGKEEAEDEGKEEEEEDILVWARISQSLKLLAAE